MIIKLGKARYGQLMTANHSFLSLKVDLMVVMFVQFKKQFYTTGFWALCRRRENENV